MGASSRRKGHAWELEVCRRLRGAGAKLAERTLTETRDGNVGDIDTDLPIVVQCKVGAAPNPWAALEEAEEAAEGRGRFAIAVVKRLRGNGRPGVELAVLPLADLEEIITQLVKGGVW